MGPAELAHVIFGMVGNVTSFLLFASPMPNIWRILKNKSVGEFSPDPYIACVMNCIFWVFYSLPVVHPHRIFVTTINSTGLALSLSYLAIYFTFTKSKKQRLKIIGALVVEVVFTAILVVITLTCLHTLEKRQVLVGILCDLFGFLLYASPLTVMFDVIKTKSVEYFPFWISVAGFCNGIVWTIYALIKIDYYIAIGNGVGAIFATSQLILYACYYKSTPKKAPKDQKPPAEVQMA